MIDPEVFKKVAKIIQVISGAVVTTTETLESLQDKKTRRGRGKR